jgi:hypothetical protein
VTARQLASVAAITAIPTIVTRRLFFAGTPFMVDFDERSRGRSPAVPGNPTVMPASA